MPGTRCTVAICNNSLIKTGKSVKYHRFPKDIELRKIWIQKCKRDGKWNAASCHVCSDHFADIDYERDLKSELLDEPIKKRLKKSAIPSLNLISNKTDDECGKKRSIRFHKRAIRKNIQQLIQEHGNHNRRTETDLTIPEANNVSHNIDTSSPSIIHSTAETSSASQEYTNVFWHRLETIVNEKKYLEKKIEGLEIENAALKTKLIDMKLQEQKTKRKLNRMILRKSPSRSQHHSSKKEIFMRIEKLLRPIITKTQLEKILYRKKMVVWKIEDISRAFTLRYLGKRSYLYLRNTLKFPLPGISTLKRWASKLEIGKGILGKVIEILKTASLKMSSIEKLVVLQFDEVKVKSCYEYCLKDDQVLGKHSQMQVVMIRSLFSNWKQPVYLEFDTPMKKEILSQIITELHEANLTAVACVSDCGGGNVGLWKELGITPENTFFKHPVTEENIYVFADVPHLLKLIRNWLIDTGFRIGDKIVNKKPLECLLQSDSAELKVCHKLTTMHLECTKFQRQNVKLAAHLLSHRTAHALKYFKPHEDEALTENTANFIELIDKWFHLFNTYKINKYCEPHKTAYGLKLKEQNEIICSVNETFRNMKCCNKTTLQIFQKGVLITNASLVALLSDIKNRFPDDIKYILTHKLNQDSLENFFSQLRSKGGFNDHPSPLDAMYRIRMIILGKGPGMVQSHLNTEDESCENYIVASVLKSVEFIQPKTENVPDSIEFDTMSSMSDGDAMNSNIKEDCEKEGLKYLAGYVAKKFLNKIPSLGKYTTPQEIEDDPTFTPSWINQISFGSLVEPSASFFDEVCKYEIYFRKFHKDATNEINTNKGVIKRLTNLIYKHNNMYPLEVIREFIKQRTFIRINYLNKKPEIYKAKRKRVGKHGDERKNVKKIKKVTL